MSISTDRHVAGCKCRGCRDARSAYMRLRLSDPSARSKHRQYVTETQRAKREFILASKARPCADCEIEYPFYVMQFDHRGDEPKVGNLSDMHKESGWAAIRAEIAKCDVVCANCHAERTQSRIAIPHRGTGI